MSSRTLSWSNHLSPSILRCALLLMAAWTGVACGGDDDQPAPQCVAALPATCTPDLDPNFDSLYTSVLSQRCGSNDSGANCHSKNANAHSDLKLTDASSAYQALLGENGHAPRVIPGDPHCSPLMERLETEDAARRMPYGENKLPAGLRCAIQQWIEKGAPR